MIGVYTLTAFHGGNAMRILGIFSIILTALLAYTLAAHREPDYDPAVFSHEEAIALYSSEMHDIVAPHSTRSLSAHRPAQSRSTAPARRPVSTPRQNTRPPAEVTALSPTLYLIERYEEHYVLYVKKPAWTASVLLVSEPVYISSSRRYEAYALRSMKPVPENGSPVLIYRNRRIGAGQDLHFLSSSTRIQHETLGDAFRITIPYKVVYGYWQTHLGTLEIEQGAKLRLTFYEQPHTPSGSKSRTYSIEIDK
jgi:hypothetical protein